MVVCPLQHLAINVPISFLATDATTIGTCRSFSDEVANNRSAAFAALMGFLMWDSYGIFIKGMGLVDEEHITKVEKDEEDAKKQRDSEKQRDRELKQMKHVHCKYTFWHHYKCIKVPVGVDASGKVVFEDYRGMQFPIEANVESLQVFADAMERYPNPIDPPAGREWWGESCHKYIAPCEVMLTETLYSKRTDVDADTSVGDARGPPCAIRIHVLLFNRKHKPHAIVQEIINSANNMTLDSNATTRLNEMRHEVNKKGPWCRRARTCPRTSRGPPCTSVWASPTNALYRKICSRQPEMSAEARRVLFTKTWKRPWQTGDVREHQRTRRRQQRKHHAPLRRCFSTFSRRPFRQRTRRRTCGRKEEYDALTEDEVRRRDRSRVLGARF